MPNPFVPMFLRLILLATATLSIIHLSDEMKMAINNSLSLPFPYPWHLSLQFKNDNNSSTSNINYNETKLWHICSAAILTNFSIIVPAYCVHSFKCIVQFELTSTRCKGQNIEPINGISINRFWNNQTFQFNTAIFTLKQELTPNHCIRPAVWTISPNITYASYTKAEVVSWHRTLKTVKNYTAWIMPARYCNQWYSFRPIDADQELCVFINVTPCSIDNGALLHIFLNDQLYLIGLSSWTIKNSNYYIFSKISNYSPLFK